MAFDTREYEWADITLIVGGEEIAGIRSVRYKEEIEREAIYAKGNQPVAIQSGNRSYDGEIIVLQSAYEQLVKAGRGSVLSISADATVHYGNPNKGDSILSKRITGMRFTEAENQMTQGDMFMEVTLPFIALNINQDA